MSISLKCLQLFSIFIISGSSLAAHQDTRLTIAPPEYFIGQVTRDLNEKNPQLHLHTKFGKSPSNDVERYEIFANKKHIGTIGKDGYPHFYKPLHPMHAWKRHICLGCGPCFVKYIKFLHRKYKVRAVSTSGAHSAFTHLKIKRSH